MPSYDFYCSKCQKTITMIFSMNDSKGRENAVCTDCSGKVNRIFTASRPIIKTNSHGMQLKPHQKMINIDGKPVMLNFIDHGDKSVENNALLRSIPGASIDEATGKPVVRIASSVPDPLGALERSNQNAQKEIITKNVNQKVKVRK